MRAGRRAWIIGASIVLGAGCAGASEGDDAPKGKTPEREQFEWARVEVGGVTPRWGSFSIEREGDTLVLGGVSGSADAVLDETLTVVATDDGLTLAADVSIDRARYCHCAMLDEARGQLVVLGGRGATFGEMETAAVIDLASGYPTELDAAGAADTPVGCQTFFFPALGRGYVFGGLSGAQGAFGSTTFRYDAASLSFTPLDIAGPPARYDGATHVLDDGTGLLVGGMGRAGLAVTFYADVWRFDPVLEAWTEIESTGQTPPGRRYPWTAVSPDESTLLLGYGSDSGMGTTVLGDLWAFSLSEGTWSPLALPDAPSARGFSYRWKGTDQSAGVLGFGFDGTAAVADAWTLLVPDAQVGRWH